MEEQIFMFKAKIKSKVLFSSIDKKSTTSYKKNLVHLIIKSIFLTKGQTKV